MSESTDRRKGGLFARMLSLFARSIGLLPPETAQHLAVWLWSQASNARPLPYLQPNHASLFFPRRSEDPRLEVEVLGLRFANPVGTAAGLDKNARIRDGVADFGFGFGEIGTVTPRPQAGNDGRRLFRLRRDRAVINRMGFNNDGLERVAQRLARRRAWRCIVGANIGANKDSADRIGDYVMGLRALCAHADYITINVSSPNTPGLRKLQDRAALETLLTRLLAERRRLDSHIPLLLKIAPDLDMPALEEIAAVALAPQTRIDGLIVSNTTITRPPLHGPDAGQAGGLSGEPLFALSTEVLKTMRKLVGSGVVLIGVGGIASGYDAYAKIRAGASLVQLYTALIYEGPGLVARIKRELLECLERDGFRSVMEAVGADLR